MENVELLARVAKTKKNNNKGLLNTRLSEARKQLESFYMSPEGIREPYRIEIPPIDKGGPRMLSVVKNVPPQDATAFWWGHLQNGTGAQRVPESRFFQRSGTLRHWSIRSHGRFVCSS